MDTADFILKREELQQRLAARRAEITQLAKSARSSILPWILFTGASVVSGLGSSQVAKRLLRSIAWAAVTPLVMGFVKKNENGFLHRIVESVFPSSRRA